MRFSLFFVIIAVFLNFAYGGEQTSNISEAKQLSVKHNKPILIDFMTDW